MTTIPIDRLEFATTGGEWPEILLARPSIWVIAYKGPGDDGWMASVTVDAYGDISVLHRLEFDAGFCSEPKMVLLSNGYVAVVYRAPGTDVWIATISVDAAGNLALVNAVELDDTTGNINLYPFIIHIAGTVYAVSYLLWGGCRLRTVNIGATGVIGAVVDTYNNYGANAMQSFILHISGDVWCIVYHSGAGPGMLVTIEIDGAGNITEPFIEEFIFDAGLGYDPRMIHLAGTKYAVVYHKGDAGGSGELFTIDIQNNGDIAAAVTATLQFYGDDAGNPNIDLFSPGIYLVTYHEAATGGDLMAITIPIGALGGIGVPTTPVELATFSYMQRQLEVYADFWLIVYDRSDGYIVGMGLQPAVTTQEVTDIAQGAAPGEGGTATGHGNVTDLGVPNPGSYGHCWNLTGTPVRSDAYVDNGPVLATGAFTSALTRLKPGLTYYVRAYVRSGDTYTYGAEVSFIADPIDTKMKVRVNALDRGPGNVYSPDAYNVYIHSKRCLVRAPDGVLWIAGVNNFVRPNTTIYVYYSVDGGLTWTYEAAVALCSALDYEHLVLLVDSDSVPIIVFYDNTDDANEGIRYVDRRGGVWGIHEMVHSTTSHWGLDAVIDATDVIHIVTNDGDITYIRGVSGSWDASELVSASGVGPVIAVDSAGKPYVVYTSAVTVLVLRERNGAWGAEEDIPGSTAGAEYPSVAMDVDDDLHVAWKDYNGDRYIFYNKRTAGVWGAHLVVFTDVISENLRGPSVAIDTDGVVYVVYDGERYVFDIRCKRITAGVLGAEEVVDGDTYPDIHFNCLGSALYHRYPDSGILPTNLQPSIYQQEEREADGRPDIYYVRPSVIAAPSGGNPGVVELLT